MSAENLSNILFVLGGLGLFLLGMLVLTDGLRQLAGNALRVALARFTKSPLTGAMTGAATTAIVQSSSATTVTTVGFVGAGLLSFPNALGIILGANIGTTMTGWLVAILGFKLKLGVVVLPLLLLGVLLRMFAPGRVRHFGWALAGFSLLFMGITAMQEGMAPFQGVVTPASFPEDTLLGRLQLVLIGVAITLITQSSSAGVAAALVGLSAGAISFPQAAALVIGMDVGTTFTAILATLGGSTAMRQTGYAHLVYNLFAATLAFFLLTPFAAFLTALGGGAIGDAQIGLVAFHTTFNVLGVSLAVPMAHPFARFIARLIPERGPPLQRRLDSRLLRDSAAAVDALVATVGDIFKEFLRVLLLLLDPGRKGHPERERLEGLRNALDATRAYVQEIHSAPTQPLVHRRHLAAMHALDHLNRLHMRCSQPERIAVQKQVPRLRRLSRLLRGVAAVVLDSDEGDAAEAKLDRLRRLLRRQRRSYRERIVAEAAEQQVDADAAIRQLDGLRWLHRVAYHLWRIQHHRHRAEAGLAPEPSAAETTLDMDVD